MSGYKSAVFCEHANECPTGGSGPWCQCPLDCSCREHMCLPAEEGSRVETIDKKNRLFFYLRGFKHGTCMLAKPPALAGNEDYERGYIAGVRAFSHAENKERSILGLPKSSLLR